jgi:single-strand DNA-binding protein
MPSLNSVKLIGNLTRDPELRHTAKGTPVCNVSIAINRVWFDAENVKHEETTFADVTTWGRLAERAAQYLRRGMLALFEGRLHFETWIDSTTEQKRSKLSVVGESMQILTPLAPKPQDTAPVAEPEPQHHAEPSPF